MHVSCGYNNSFVVTQDGYVYSWGEGTHGQLGRDVDIAIEAKPPKQAKGGPTQGDIGGVYTPTPMRCFAIEKLIRNSGPTQVHAQSGLRDRVLYRRLMLVGGHDYAMAWFSSDDSLHTIMGGKSLSSGVEGAGGTVASTPLCSRCLHFEGDNASLKSEKQQIEVNALHLKVSCSPPFIEVFVPTYCIHISSSFALLLLYYVSSSMTLSGGARAPHGHNEGAR